VSDDTYLMPLEFKAERYVGKMYDMEGHGTRLVTITAKEDWPDDFRPGTVIDLEVKAQSPDGALETFRLFGEVAENDGQVLRVDARVVGERPRRVWSIP